MIAKLKILSIFITANILFTECKQNNSGDEFSFDKIYNYGIQEDVSKIVKALNTIPDDSLSVKQKEIKENYIARFQTKTEKFDFKTQDSLIVNVLTIFHDYWIDVLMKNKSLKKSEEINGPILLNFIRSYPCEKDEVTNSKDIYLSLSNLLRYYGYYSQIGRTGNIMDLFIWTNQSNETYPININDSMVNVHVVFIDSIITLGWEEYATFGHLYPRGWTKSGSDSLYCVKKDYDVNSENFKVSFLAHEAQHLTDAKMYSGFTRWTAEYRAKLSELSMAENGVYNLINFFIQDSKNDSRLTHPYAEYRVIIDLSKEIFNENFVIDIQKWKGISYQEINKISKKLLKQNSTGLKRIQ